MLHFSSPLVVGVVAFMAGMFIGLAVGALMGAVKRGDLQADVLRLRRERNDAVAQAQEAARVVGRLRSSEIQPAIVGRVVGHRP